MFDRAAMAWTFGGLGETVRGPAKNGGRDRARGLAQISLAAISILSATQAANVSSVRRVTDVIRSDPDNEINDDRRFSGQGIGETRPTTSCDPLASHHVNVAPDHTDKGDHGSRI
jgi:hypothetical protein